MLWVADKFEVLPENRLLVIFGSRISEKNWDSGPGTPRRDPGRNSVPDPGFKIPNGGMATHLVAKMCDLGSLGVPGPASTPGWGTDLQSTLKRPGKIYHWNLTVRRQQQVWRRACAGLRRVHAAVPAGTIAAARADFEAARLGFKAVGPEHCIFDKVFLVLYGHRLVGTMHDTRRSKYSCVTSIA